MAVEDKYANDALAAGKKAKAHLTTGEDTFTLIATEEIAVADMMALSIVCSNLYRLT